MVIDIDKIIVKDRIRKDFGDIQELADDIQQNGLINPPVINKEYVLLAGERRLRACKTLGWNQIEVRMMDTKDVEHDLEVEISENETRKDFSRAEREAIYTRRVEMKMKNSGVNLPRKKAEEDVAKEMGTSRSNMQHERKIIENRDLLDPSDFADWDEGKLSTNKAYQKLKAAQSEAERKLAEKDRKIFELENRPAEIREVVKEVVPEDYKHLKQELHKSQREARAWKQDYRKEQDKIAAKSKEILKLQDEVEELKRQTVSEKNNHDLNGSAITFAMECRVFLQNMGGYTFVAEHLMELNESERKGYIVAAKAMQDWATILLDTIERNKGGLYGTYND